MRHLNVKIRKYELPGGETLLRDTALVINETDRIAVVGGNGAGKTTFMRILTGEIAPSSPSQTTSLALFDGSIDNA